jgi:predicted metal-dependent hydrolase
MRDDNLINRQKFFPVHEIFKPHWREESFLVDEFVVPHQPEGIPSSQ